MRLYKGLLRFTEQLVNLVRNAMVWWLKERKGFAARRYPPEALIHILFTIPIV
jgi:hypothetical protein